MDNDVSFDPRVRQTVEALADAFARQHPDSPWTVRPTAAGAEVALDIVDARWWDMFRRVGLRMAYSFSVRLDPESGVCAVTDERRAVQWRAGVDGRMHPVFDAVATVDRGRVMTVNRTYVAGAGREPVVDVTFNSEGARSTLRGVLKEYGWKERMGTEQKIGLGFAVFGGLVAVGVLVAMLVMNVF